MDEKTLLFLTSLKPVKWCSGTTTAGEVLREKHSDVHFKVLKRIDSKTTSSSHFLKFDQSVPDLEKQRVAVAFAPDLFPGTSHFDAGRPLVDLH